MNELGLYRNGIYVLILSPDVYVPLHYDLTCAGCYTYMSGKRKFVGVLT